ncbi:FAD-dependent monooxygenase [Rhizobium leguminosarum]|uniref:FAD-dependent monooxygenase n=1 Tax=Rhizobium leguminosarum TaxID=384 RepID=UPI003ECFF22B
MSSPGLRRSKYDFAVIGGGPAGRTASALLAGGGARVLLIDAARPVNQKQGEFIDPKVKGFISKLGLLRNDWQAPHLHVPGFINGWGPSKPQERDFIFDPYGSALALDRHKFETQLLEAALSRGVEMRAGWTVRRAHHTPGQGWRIFMKAKDIADEIDAHYLIMGMGRHANPPIGSVKCTKFDRLAFVAAFIHKPILDRRPSIECFEAGWAYASPLSESACVVYIFFDAQLGSPIQRTSASLRYAVRDCERLSSILDSILEDPDVLIEWFAGPAHSSLASQVFGERWCLIGDFAQSRDPLAAAGLYGALRDASLMTSHLLAGGPTAEACEAMELERLRSFAGYLQSRHQFYAEETRWPDHPFWSGKGGSLGRELPIAGP